MTIRTALACLLVAGLATTAMAQQAGASMTSAPGKVTVKEELKLSAVVTAINAEKRIITLKGEKGKVREIEAGPEVRNFAQIKVGDQVKIKAHESLTLELLKGGAGNPTRVEGSGETQAKKGAKPAAGATEHVIVVADVVSVDRQASTVLVKGPHHSMTLEVRDPAQLKLIEVGDRIKGTYEAAIAISVETLPAKK